MRGVRYGEVLGVYLRDEGLQAEVYGTQMLNDCPQELWEKLDPAAIAADLGAVFVKLNGPRYWLLDGLGTKVAVVDPAGTAYVMQAMCVGVDPSLAMADLDALGARLDLPEGWTYRMRMLSEELVVDTTDRVAVVLQDELENSYTLP